MKHKSNKSLERRRIDVLSLRESCFYFNCLPPRSIRVFDVFAVIGIFLFQRCLKSLGDFKMNTRNFTRTLLFLFFFCLLAITSFQTNSICQTRQEKLEELWKKNLYKENVQYENFACSAEDSEIVKTFFVNRPLNIKLPICHNDCPIIKSRPVVPFPTAAKAAKVTGNVSVHVLVNEKGKVLYARVLSGHPLLWAVARKGACETQFKEYSDYKHQGVMHFTVDGYEFLEVPNVANQVW